MSTPDVPGRPEPNYPQFSIAVQARANEFVGQAARLAIWTAEWTPGDDGDIRGAQYTLPDGTQWAVIHENWRTKAVAKVRLTRPFIEHIGTDGYLRRARVARYMGYHPYDNPDDTTMVDLELLPPADLPVFPSVTDAERDKLDWRQVEESLGLNSRPLELIKACTAVLVEVKPPGSPDFYEERYSNDMRNDTKLAHQAIRTRAGEPKIDPPYNIAEHKAVMAVLAGIDPNRIEPQPLDDEFDET